ncbi:MAG: hypothetical protein QM752_08095 [Gammaproteobacteria bacterium]
MANLLKKIDTSSVHSIAQKSHLDQIKKNLEELSDEIQFLKKKVVILVQSQDNEDEIKDTFYRLKDIQNSLRVKKADWKVVIKNSLENQQVDDVLGNLRGKLLDIESTLHYIPPGQ